MRLPSTPHIPRGYAVVIGISEYPKLGKRWQLHYADRDAESIYSVLISPEGGNYRAENVHLLLGPNATLANIEREIGEWLPGVAQEDDRVFIDFAGHGFVKRGKAYLAPSDFDVAVAERAYPMDTLGRVIGSRIKAKAKIVLTDACHSGALLPESDSPSVNRALANLDQSVFSLTASRDREPSHESPDYDGGHGIFTYFAVRGLRGEADENCDGVVNADELAEYVHANVRKATNGLQNPTSDRGSYDARLLLAYNPTRPGCSAR